jgi:hypothetical protein
LYRYINVVKEQTCTVAVGGKSTYYKERAVAGTVSETWERALFYIIIG